MSPLLQDPLKAVATTKALSSQLSSSGDLVLEHGATVLAGHPARSTVVDTFSEMIRECMRLKIRPSNG